MKRLIRWFKNMKIREKLISSHIIIALIPFLLLGITWILVSMQGESENVKLYTTQRVGQVQQILDVYFNDIEKTANVLGTIIETMDLDKVASEEEPLWSEYCEELMEDFRVVGVSNEEIAGIFLATEHDLYLGRGMTRISRDSFIKEKWYQKALENPDKIQIISDITGRNIVTDKTYSIDDVFSVVKAVRSQETGQVMGVLLFDVKYDTIASVIQRSAVGEDGFAFVIDNQDRMVYTPANKIVYRIDPDWLRSEDHLITASINKVKYQISCQMSEYAGWRIISVSSYEAVMQKSNQVFILIMVVLFFTILLVLISAVKVSSTITKPIVKLNNLMERTEEGDLSVRFEYEYADEIGKLGRRFNHMLEEVQKLLDEVYLEQENKRKAQLQVVQEQFKPHFLYNTLDTIGWMAREHSAQDIVQIVDALTSVFRISLSKGKEYITVEEEFRYVSNYLYIQRIRYGPKVDYDIHADEQVGQILVPKLILQPIVENAIYHGVKLKKGPGHLKIYAYEREQMLELSVEDDGNGMTEEKAIQLMHIMNHSEKEDEHESFGLYYVGERLRIRYDQAFRVIVESREGKGTKVIIRISMEEQERWEQI